MWGNSGDLGWRARTLTALVVGAALLAGACSHPEDEPAGGSGSESGSGGGRERSGDFTLLSYNVAGLPQEISPENPQEHLPLISPLLDEYDLVLTQEDFDWWQPRLEGSDFVDYHERLRAETTHEHRSARYPGPEAAGIDLATRPDLQIGDGLGILSRFPFEGEERVAWEGCFGGFDTSDGGAADCLAAKGFAVVRMALDDGVEVDVYTLHAEAGGTVDDQTLQTDDFAKLTTFVIEHSEGRAVILAGDTNLHTDPSHPDAYGTVDTAIWEAFIEATGLTDACTATGCPDTGAIDKVAYRSARDGSVELEATTHELPRERFTSPAGEALSDHAPLVVAFSWNT